MTKEEIDRLVNDTKQTLGVTQGELGLMMGVSAEAPTQGKSTGKISKMAVEFMKLLVKDYCKTEEIKRLEEVEPTEELKSLVEALKTVDDIKDRY